MSSMSYLQRLEFHGVVVVLPCMCNPLEKHILVQINVAHIRYVHIYHLPSSEAGDSERRHTECTQAAVVETKCLLRLGYNLRVVGRSVDALIQLQQAPSLNVGAVLDNISVFFPGLLIWTLRPLAPGA